MKTHRVLLVEDHPALRQALAWVLEEEPDLTVVGQAGTLAEAREVSGGVDLAIIDPGLPDGDGVELIPELRERNPDCRVLVLTASLDHLDFARAVEAGAEGVLNKTVSIQEILNAVRRLRAGETLLSAGEVIELMGFAALQQDRDEAARAILESLTAREREVLAALAAGNDNSEIARRLGIAIETERYHMAHLLTKLGVKSRLQALLFALRHNFV
ncbi:MAG TPA: response regulator transcription factor [Rubrobacteraceae bacterium]|nr:response regulator transcription factor [Rubrobacteraceae bacterium]